MPASDQVNDKQIGPEQKLGAPGVGGEFVEVVFRRDAMESFWNRDRRSVHRTESQSRSAPFRLVPYSLVEVC